MSFVMHRISPFVLCSLLFCISQSYGLENRLVTVASGETHAMLFACDCPTEPGGGFAKRATVIRLLRDTGDVLLVDVGGFAGGDLYDPYTEGRANDSLRTMAALRAMGYMKYDAVCVGDDDLQYGGQWLARQAFYDKVPLVSANCFYANGKPLAAPFVIVKRGKYSIGITGVTTQESLLHEDTSLSIRPPVQMLRKIWKTLKASSDFQVILAHIGEDGSRQLLDSFPDCALVVNGHRKTATEEFVTDRGQVMLQFGFQGKSLSFAEIVSDSKGPSVGKTGWISIGPSIPEDPAVSKLVTIPVADTGKKALPVFDLYIMAQCQFGCAALREFTAVIQTFPSIQWSVWFIGTTFMDGTVSSMHGQAEINDELLWLAVGDLYPDQWLQFLRNRSALPSAETGSVIRSMGLDYSKITAWVAKKGMDKLRMNYTRSMRMGVNASPTMLVNNTVLQQEPTAVRLSKIICARMSRPSAACDSLPECISDDDCTKPGAIGSCVAKGGRRAACEFKDALRFTLTIVTPDSGVFHPEFDVVAGVRNDFPGVVIDTLKAGSAQGKKLIGEYAPQFLPLFLFDKAMESAPNFSSFSQGLVPVKSKFVFKQGMFKPSYFYKRGVLPGTIRLYVDPLFSGAADAIRIARQPLPQGRNLTVSVMPDFYEKPDSAGLSPEEALRQEEALRWLVLQKFYPDRFGPYLSLFCARKTMSYWFTDCQKLGIDVDAFVKKVQAEGQASLHVYWGELSPLGMKGPVEVLINNREVAAVKSPKELADLLQKFRTK